MSRTRTASRFFATNLFCFVAENRVSRFRSDSSRSAAGKSRVPRGANSKGKKENSFFSLKTRVDPFQHFINERILELHRIGERRIIRKSLRKAVKSEGKSGRSSVSCCHFEAFIRSVGYVGPDREKRKDRSRGRKEGRLTVYRATISEARRYRAWEGVELGVGNEADEGASCISMGRART